MKGTPKDIGDELTLIQKKANGLLRAEDVVEYARDPKTHLHSRFDWNDTAAAQKWRVHQARNLIRVWVEILPQVEKEHRVCVSLLEDRAQPGGGYRLTVDVMSDKQRRASLLEQAKAELDAFRRKYRDLEELAEVFAAIKRVGKAG